MPHLDEGQLHAYLDGQPPDGMSGGRSEVERHLAECAECRARLEVERRIRDQVQAVMRATGPAAISPPPFEAVLKRAAQQRARRSGTRPMVALAWAASLALAVTVGWYARSIMLVNTETGAAAGAGGAEGALAAEQQVRAQGIEAAPPAARQLAQAAPPREGAQPPQPAVGAGAVAPTAGPPAQSRDVANLAAAEAKAAADTEAERHMAEAPAPAAPPVAAMRQPAAARAAEPRVAAPLLAEQTWITVTPAEAERRLGGPLAIIPGLPSLGTSVYGSGESTVARTIQVLGPGQTIELVQRPAAGRAKERADAPTEAAGSVTIQWEGFSVTGRALVPVDSLRTLLGRLPRP